MKRVCVAFMLLPSCSFVTGRYTRVVDVKMEASVNHYELLPAGERGSVYLHGLIPLSAQNPFATRTRARWVTDGFYRESYILKHWGEPDERKKAGGVDYLFYTGPDPVTGAGIRGNLSPDLPTCFGYRRGQLVFSSAYFRRGRGFIPDVEEWVVP